jgi:ankyrin repeat protein
MSVVTLKVKSLEEPVVWTDVELAQGCSWEAITSAVATQIGLLSREEILFIQSIDENGESLSAKINNAPKFWALMATSVDSMNYVELTIDKELSAKLAEAVAIEKFRASAVEMVFCLASDLESVVSIWFKNNTPWEELKATVANEFAIPVSWIDHFIVVDSENDELSDVLNTGPKFWRFGNGFDASSGNVFVVHIGEAAVAETKRQQAEAEMRKKSVMIRVRYGDRKSGTIKEVYVPKSATWDEITFPVGKEFGISESWIQGFYFMDSTDEKLSANLNNAVKFWKFAGNYDSADGCFFHLVIDEDARAKFEEERKRKEFEASAQKIKIRRQGDQESMLIFIPLESTWKEITSTLAEALKTHPDAIDELIWLDGDNDELAPSINSDVRFWKLVDKYDLDEGQYFLVVENKEKLADINRRKREEDFKATSKLLMFRLAMDGARNVEVEVSPLVSTWESLLETLSVKFEPLSPSWVSYITLCRDNKDITAPIKNMRAFWDNYEDYFEHDKGKDNFVYYFKIYEHPGVREDYAEQLRQQEFLAQKAEQDAELERQKLNAKEILVEVEDEDFSRVSGTAYIPYSSNWEELCKVLAKTSSIDHTWISHIVLVDASGDDMSVPIRDIKKFWKLCGEEYSVSTGYKFRVLVDRDVVIEYKKAKELEEFKKNAAHFTVFFEYDKNREIGEVYIAQNSSWDKLLAAFCSALNNIVDEATIDHLSLRDENGDELYSPIRNAEKFWALMAKYKTEMRMNFEVFDPVSLAKLEAELKKSELQSSRQLCRFKVAPEPFIRDSGKAVEIFIQLNFTWEEILETVCRSFNFIAPKCISHLVLFDADGDELSTSIDSAQKFWKIAGSYNLNDGFLFIIYVSEEKYIAYEKEQEFLRLRSTEVNFKVVIDEGGELNISEGNRRTVWVQPDSKWNVVSAAILSGLELDASENHVESITLIDEEGDHLSPPTSTDTKFWKMYYNNSKLSQGVLLFAVDIRRRPSTASTKPQAQVQKAPALPIPSVSTYALSSPAPVVSFAAPQAPPSPLSPAVIHPSPEVTPASTPAVTTARSSPVTVPTLAAVDPSVPFKASAAQAKAPVPLPAVGNISLDKPVIDLSKNKISLHEACLNGDLNIVHALLASGANVNADNDANAKPIHFASVNGDVSIMKLLCDAGADTSSTNADGSTPLHFACEQGHEALILFLLSKGCSLTTPNHSGIVPLDYLSSEDKAQLFLSIKKTIADFDFNKLVRVAAEHSLENLVKLLIKHHLTLLEDEDKDRRTVLHVACQSGSIDIAKWLIRNGANIFSKDCDSMTPFLHACCSGNLKLVRFLLANGTATLLDDVDSDNNTALHFCSRRGYLSLVQYLVKFGVDVNRRNARGQTASACAEEAGFVRIDRWLRQYSGAAMTTAEKQKLNIELHKFCRADSISDVKRCIEAFAQVNSADNGHHSPLFAAITNGSLEIVTYLAENGADLTKTNSLGYSPLLVASGYGFVEISKYLVDCGVDWARSVRGTFPAHIAALMGQADLVQYFMNLGAAPNLKNSGGYTCLHLATISKSLNVIEVLAQSGCDLDLVQSDEGFAPLHLAAYKGSLPVVQYLINQGAFIEATDFKGRTPFLCAAAGGDIETLEWLWARRCNIHALTREKRTALHLAAERGHLVAVQWLLEKGFDLRQLSSDGKTPFHLALLNGRREVIDFIYSYLQRSNIFSPDEINNFIGSEIFLTSSGGDLASTRFCLDELSKRVDRMYRLPGDALMLHFAAASNHTHLIETFIRQGVPVDSQSSIGRTALHYAAIKGNVDTAKLLLKHGANPMVRDRSNQTPYDSAREMKQMQFAKYMLPIVKELNAKPSVSSSWFACVSNTDASGTGMQSFSLDENDVFRSESFEMEPTASEQIIKDWFDLPDEFEKTAAELERMGSDETEILSIALSMSTDAPTSIYLDASSESLHNACASGDIAYVQRVLGQVSDIDVKNSQGLTPLYIACDKQYGDIAIVLIKKKANLGVLCGPGDCPLHRICARGMTSLLDQIMSFPPSMGIRIPFDTKTSTGMTAMHVAAKAGFTGIVKLLVKGANMINTRDSFGRTAVHYACASKNVEMVEFLIANNAFLNVRDVDGVSPLALSISLGGLAIAKVLVLNGASTMSEDDQGNTLLHTACARNDLEAIKWLLSLSLPKSARNSSGKTPMDILAANDFRVAMDILNATAQ